MKYDSNGQQIFVIFMLILFFPFVLLGVLFDLITKHRVLYFNVYKPWEMHLGDSPHDNGE
jgi:hypothetical protein